MIAKILPIWALFLGIGLITIGNGLQGTLLSLRGIIEGFSTLSIGTIMSSYYGGFFMGSILIPKLVKRVGHIRVFAAFASLASVTILAHSVILQPFIWGVIRFLSGFSFAGLFIVAESWLNDQSENDTRGKILSIYMGVNHGGFFLGQILLNFGNPEGYFLFILISILLSLSLVPILLTASPAPSFGDPEHINLNKLYNISPTGVVGAAVVGLTHGSLWGMGPVFVQKLNFGTQYISIYMGALILGGFILQWPIGFLSDKFDRRFVLNIVLWSSCALSLLCAFLPPTGDLVLLIGAFLLGGALLPLYSLCIAHTNDHLSRNQMVSASSTMVLVYGGGAFMGPAIASIWMVFTGPFGLFFHLCVVQFCLGIFFFYRIQKSPPVSLEQQEPLTLIPPRTSPVVACLTSEEVKDETDANFNYDNVDNQSPQKGTLN